MDTVITAFLSKVVLGDVRRFENLAIIPLFAPVSEGPSYLTLKEASEQRLLTVTEVDGGGSVPELKAVNNGDLPVLLLDGEELAGAKQNRVLNTTILLKAKSETVIPVTCTEQGRWARAAGGRRHTGCSPSPGTTVRNLRFLLPARGPVPFLPFLRYPSSRAHVQRHPRPPSNYPKRPVRFGYLLT